MLWVCADVKMCTCRYMRMCVCLCGEAEFMPGIFLDHWRTYCFLRQGLQAFFFLMGAGNPESGPHVCMALN